MAIVSVKEWLEIGMEAFASVMSNLNAEGLNRTNTRRR